MGSPTRALQPSASLIVYAPLSKPAGEHPYTFQMDEPQLVWWLAEHTLYQASDLVGDIDRYRQEAIVASPSAVWHYYSVWHRFHQPAGLAG